MTPSNPILIEITGSLGLGKGWLVESLSKTFGCPGINFPTFDPNSFTSQALIKGYQRPEALINNPQWWAHLVAANIYEQLPVIRSQPLVIMKNYVTGYRNWFTAVGVDQAGAYVSGLPRPNLVFVCRGEKLPIVYAMEDPTTPELERAYERRLAQVRGTNVHLIDYQFFKDNSASTDSLLSVVSLTLAEKIRNKYDLVFRLKPKNYTVEKLQSLEDGS